MGLLPQSDTHCASQYLWEAYSQNGDTHCVSVSPQDISSESDADCSSESVWKSSLQLGYYIGRSYQS